ncbi:MAG TPA: autotransporter-associated beta strand repeat-containing protein [Verrucomicrobiae bacterium]|nr:autotransporter-associated beta strand repeat-containing protein [Verrucomicrobiae bacterium]
MITKISDVGTSKPSTCVVRAVATAVIGLSLVWISPARAQIWSSTNTVDDYWSDPASWTNNQAPIAGGSANYTISFDNVTTGNVNSTNDLGTAANNGFLLNQLILNSGTVTVLGSNLVFASSGAVLPQVVNNNGSNTVLSTDGVILNTNLTFVGAGASSVAITGAVSGVGGLILNGAYTVILESSNSTYAGNTVINSNANLQLSVTPYTIAGQLPAGPGAGNVFVNGGGTLTIENVNTAVNGLFGAGTVTQVGHNTRTLTIGSNDVSSTFNGTLMSPSGNLLSLYKVGAGTFVLAGQDLSGAQIAVTNGQLVLANSAAATNASLCPIIPGNITFSNSTVFYCAALGPIGNKGTVTGNIVLNNTAGQPITLVVGNSNQGTFTTYSGQLSGSGGLELNWSTYLLRVQTTNAIYQGDTVINAGTLDLNIGGWFPYGAGAGNLVVGSSGVVGLRTVSSNGTYNVNGLSGSGLIEGFNGGGSKFLVVGNNNASSIFAGTIQNSDPSTNYGPIGITKVGTGALTLTGTNTYSSPTTISGGVLAIAGAGSITNTSTITINTGCMLDVSQASGGATIGGVVTQSFRGFGSVNGSLTLGSMAVLAPGTNAAPGTLTFSNNLVITSGAVLNFDAGAATDLAVVDGNLSLDGTLNVGNGGGITNQTYTLFTYAGTLTTNGSPTILDIASVPNSNFTYSISIATPHQVNLVVTCPTCVAADPYTTWQSYYFGGNSSTLSYGTANPTGDGMSNTNKFMAGFNPTNGPAYLHIVSIAKSSANVVVTYLGASGDSSWSPGIASRTNILEVTTGSANGSYSNSFVSAGQTNILSGGAGLGQVTSFIDTNGATSGTRRYYRVRVLLP